MTDEKQIGPFQELLRGEVEELHIYVSTYSTSVNKDKDTLDLKPDGVYVMTRDDFRKIGKALIEDHPKRWGVAPKSDSVAMTAFENNALLKVAEACDAGGFADRWFRLSASVAEWIARSEPLDITINAVIT